MVGKLFEGGATLSGRRCKLPGTRSGTEDLCPLVEWLLLGGGGGLTTESV